MKNIIFDSDGTPMFVTNALIPRKPKNIATLQFVRIEPSRNTRSLSDEIKNFLNPENCPKCGKKLIGSSNPDDPKICSNKDCRDYIQCPECAGEMIQFGKILMCRFCHHEIGDFVG